MRTIAGNSLIQRIDILLAAPMGDELAMMDTEKGKYLVLDRVGSIIWGMIGEPLRIDDLLSRLEEKFDVTSEQCRADVEQFLTSLEARGLIHVSEAGREV